MLTKENSAEALSGLCADEVRIRREAGQVNVSKQKHGKSYGRIIFDNLCTAFNILYLVIAIILIAFGNFQNLTFAAVVLPNILLAIISEIRAKAIVDKLSVTTDPRATVIRDGEESDIPSGEIVLGDLMKLEISRQILADAVVVSGVCEVNESMLTGESVPVKKQEGDSLFAGSFLVSGSVIAEVIHVGDDNYLNTIESAAKQHKKPTSNLFRSLDTLIRAVGIFMVPMTIATFIVNWFVASADSSLSGYELAREVAASTAGSVIAMIPAGMYLLVTLTLSLSVVILGRKNTLVQDMYSIEMLARADILCLDKTGTITDGTMRVSEVIPLADYNIEQIAAAMAALESIDGAINATSKALKEYFGDSTARINDSIAFSSQRKYSAADIEGLGAFAVGAPHFVPAPIDTETESLIELHAERGERVLLLSKLNGLAGEGRAIALIAIADNIRAGAEDTIARFQAQDVTVKVISGDHAGTVSAIATKVGIANADKYISCENITDEELEACADEYAVFGRVTPEQKVLLVNALKRAGHTVAMTGDGVNDTLALKEANCAIAMAEGSEVACGVSQIVLMDSDFSHLPEVVREGRRCINNVRGSASLFVMKTVFAIMISLFAVFTVTGYPFQPKNFVFLELFIIGVGSFLLALEPNNERIKGDFLEHVLTCSVPYAIALFIPTLALLIFGSYSGYPISTEVRDAIAMCAVIVAGYINLTNICRPYTKWRLGVVIGIGVLLVGGIGLGFLLDDAFGFGFHSAITDPKVLIIAVVMAAASAIFMHLLREPISRLVSFIMKKINEKKAKTK